MRKLQKTILLLLCSYAAGSGGLDKSPGSTSTSAVPETKKTTGKRDSSAQTATFAEKQNDEPFKPIYHPPYLEAPTSKISTTRYIAEAAEPQASYYGKMDLPTGLKNTVAGGAQNIQHQHGGNHYASNAYSGPFNPEYQHYQPQQQQQSKVAKPQGVKTSSNAAVTPTSMYTYSEPDINYRSDPLPPQAAQNQYQYHPNHHVPQQQIQYIIAIPLMHSRHLPQQLQAYTMPAPQPVPIPHHMMHVVSALARDPDHQSMHRPMYYSPPQLETMPFAPAQSAFTTKFIQIPLSVLSNMLFAKPLQYLQSDYPLQQQQQHHQQLQQPPKGYAYPAQQPQPQQHQLQQKQQPQQSQSAVRVGSDKSTVSTHPPIQSAPSTPILTSLPATIPHSQPSPPPSHIQHYNPMYVQAPPMEQQAIIGANSYVRYSQGLHGPMQIPLMKMSAPRAFTVPQAPPYFSMLPAAHQFYSGPLPPTFTKMPYESSGTHLYAAPAYASQETAGVPYISHPGAIHYGTHLYHPPIPTSPSKGLTTGTTPAVLQQQQYHPPNASPAGTTDTTNSVAENTKAVRYS